MTKPDASSFPASGQGCEEHSSGVIGDSGPKVEEQYDMTSLANEIQTSAAAEAAHLPVMVQETLQALAPVEGGSYIDCNLGEGGHTSAILNSTRSAQVLGIDLDYDALVRAAERLSQWSGQLFLHHGNFADIYKIASSRQFVPVAGVLFDLGLSSAQLDEPDRGFSFRRKGPLDMRFNPESGVSASDIVNRWSESRLENIIYELGEEPRAGRVARGIVRSRPIDNTIELANVVIKSLNWPTYSRIHPATRTFQALRMAVNEERENLERGLEDAVQALRPGGRLVVISYHSIEDRAVKSFIRRSAASCTCPPSIPECVCNSAPTLIAINKRVIRPTLSETRENPRARSARMRVAERI